MSCIDFNSLEKTSIPKRRIECYQLYLERLVDHLNYVHNTSHDSKYWEILIGPWLLDFIWYIDYGCFGNNSMPRNSAKIDSKSYVPYDLFSFMHRLDLSDYSYQVDSIINNRPEDSETSFECFRDFPGGDTLWWKVLGKKIYAYIYKLISGGAYVVLAAPYFSLIEQSKMALLLRLRVIPFLSVDNEKRNLLLNWEYRKWREERTAFENDLDNVLDKLVLQRMPYVHLEGYLHLVKKLPPLSPKLRVICSSVGWHHDELAKCLFAAHWENGGLLVGIQHGGNPYGTGINPLTLAEKEFADKYLTWGWKKNEKDDPFVSIKVSLRKKEFDSKSHKKGEDVLYATASFCPYSHDGMGFPTSKNLAIYFKLQHRFVRSLSPKVRDQMAIRIYPADPDFGHGQREQFEGLGLNLKIDENKFLMDSLLNSKLIVLDNIITVFFEVIAYGIPIVVFHDESMWEFDLEFETICDEMKKVGMLHTSPESAAKFVSKNVAAIEYWWDSGDVQRVVEHLKSTYVRTCDDPIKMLSDKLLQIAES